MEKYFNKENVYINVKGNNFKDVLKNVAFDLEKKGFVKDSFFNAVIERENNFPTGLEFPSYSIAIPHTDSEHVNDNSIVVIKPENTIIFKDMGTNSKNLEVNVILLLLVSKNDEQVKVLSNIIKKFANDEIYNKILDSNNEQEIYSILTK